MLPILPPSSNNKKKPPPRKRPRALPVPPPTTARRAVGGGGGGRGGKGAPPSSASAARSVSSGGGALLFGERASTAAAAAGGGGMGTVRFAPRKRRAASSVAMPTMRRPATATAIATATAATATAMAPGKAAPPPPRKLTWATIETTTIYDASGAGAGAGGAGYEHDEEDALVLAAEAAAALIADDGDGVSVGVVVDGASLEDVVARAGGGGAAATRGDAARMTTATTTATTTTTRGGGGCGRSDDDGQHPLGGPHSRVRTFESKVPHSSDPRCGDMPAAQRDFVSGYYAAGERGDGGVVIGGGRRRGVGVGGGGGDGDEEEEVEDGDGDGDETVAASGGRNGAGGDGDRRDDGTEEVVEDDGGDADATAGGGIDHDTCDGAAEEGGGGAAADATAIPAPTAGPAAATLRALCRRIPRSLGKARKNAAHREGGDEVRLLRKEDGEEQGEGRNTRCSADGAAVGGSDDAPPEPPPSGPRVTFDENGFIVIDQSSLLINPESRQSTSQIDAELGGDAVVEEGENDGRLGAIQARYDAYTTHPRTVPTRWSARETRAFYDALRQCGTDFGLMQMFCVGRTRMQLKRKFKVESRKNPRLVDMALDPKCKVKLDLSVFGDNLEIPEEVPDFVGGVTPTDSAAQDEGGPVFAASAAKKQEEDPEDGEDGSAARPLMTGDSRSHALRSMRDFTDF